MIIRLVRVRELAAPRLTARLGLEQFIDGDVCQPDQLVLRGRIVVPHCELHPLAHITVIEFGLDLELGVQIVVDLFGLSDHFPPIVLVLLNEADGIALAKSIQVFKLLAFDYTSQSTSCRFDHFRYNANLFTLFINF